MLRTATVVALSLAAALLTQPASSARAAQLAEPALAAGPAAMADGIIVKLAAGAGVAEIRADVADAVGGAVARTTMPGGLVALRTGPITEAEATALAREVAARPDVAWAEANAMAHPDDTGDVLPPPTNLNDPLYPILTNIWDSREARDIAVAAAGPTPWPVGGYAAKAPSLWRATRGNPGLVLAVVDTGVRPTHPDLAAALVPGYDMITDPTTANDGDGRDADASDPGDFAVDGDSCYTGTTQDNSSWHGTHVAGTAAAPADNALGVAGVAPAVKIQPVRVLGKCGGFIADIAAGIQWAAGVAVPGLPVNTTPATVINMSLGGTGACGEVYQAAIDAARARGATIVVSAGNDNFDAMNKRPANCNGVVVVGALREYGDRAYYSNFGATVDVSAPGGVIAAGSRGVVSTYNAGTTVPGADSYDDLQGTSMAAPAVSGAAMLLASLGTFSPDQLEAALKTTVIPFPTSIQGGWRQCLVGICGSGALSLDQVPAPVSAPTFSGRAAAGSTVTAVAAGWTGPATPMAYTWLVNGVAVSSGPSYHLPASALGSTLALRAGPAAGAFTPINRDSSPVTVAKAFSKTKLKGPRRVARFGRPEITVKVKAGLNPTGKLKVFDGKKKIGTVKLKGKAHGKVTLRLKPLTTLGVHKVRVTYSGSPTVAGSRSSKLKITVVRR